jgi:hypothetical protein
MNMTQRGSLLLINGALSFQGPPSIHVERVWKSRYLGPLATIRPVDWTPVRLPLEAAEGSASPKRRLAAVLCGGATVVGLAAAIYFAVGMQRMQEVRRTYQVSLQLRQRERQLSQAQRAYRGLEAYVAVQRAWDIQQAELARVAAPTPPLKRTTRS